MQKHFQFYREIKKTIKLNYLLHLPDEYTDTDKNYPFILYLHGGGSRGDDLSIVKKNGIPRLIEEQGDFDFITAAPQCPIGFNWLRLKEEVMLLLDELIEQYRIDPDRIYLTGVSMGGYGTWDLAAHYPDRFAAIAPLCGTGFPEGVKPLKDIPVWAFHGDQDPQVPFQRGKEMVDSLKAIGGNVRFTVYPDTGHMIAMETYRNPELYEWFLSHTRKGPSHK